MKRSMSIWSVLLAFVLAGGSTAVAQETLELKAGDLRGATGEAVIKDATEGQKEITITASGLRPNSVYTLWFVNETPRMDALPPVPHRLFKSTD
jgi:hypothetical protein